MNSFHVFAWLWISPWRFVWVCQTQGLFEEQTKGSMSYLGVTQKVRNSERHDLDSFLILCQSSQSLGWEMDCVCTSEGLSEKHSSSLRADLSQITGNEAQHKQNLVFTLSKKCQAGLQHLWTNTNKINFVTTGCGHHDKGGIGGNYKEKGGFPGDSSGKEPACQWRRLKRHGLGPWVRKIPWRREHGNPLQYSCLENPIDRGAWQATVHGVAKSQTQLQQLKHACTKKKKEWEREKARKERRKIKS